MLRLGGDIAVLGEHVLTALNALVGRVDALALERRPTVERAVEGARHRPVLGVDGRAALLEDLGRHVVGRSAHVVHAGRLHLAKRHREAEVRQLYREFSEMLEMLALEQAWRVARGGSSLV